MNISPILLLSVGATFALLYAIIITVGWAITRKNRKRYHQSLGLNEIELYDLQSGQALNKYSKSISLSGNYFRKENGEIIDPENFKCYIVEKVSEKFPKIKKGYLIFMNPQTNTIEFAFDIPNINNYR